MRKWLPIALGGLVILVAPSVAFAHATFVGAPSGFPANTDQTLTMNVPHERDDSTYNVDVVVAMPAGWTPLSCEPKPTWTCTLGSQDGRQTVHFTKESGAQPAEDETFRFVVHTASPGTFSFPTLQTYNTGEIVRWIGAAGSPEPAPVLATVPSGASTSSTVTTTNPDKVPTTTIAPPTTTSRTPSSNVPTTAAVASSTTVPPGTSPVTTPTTTPTASTTTAESVVAAPSNADGGGGGGGGGSHGAVVAIAAVIIAAVGVGALAGRGLLSRAGSNPSPSSPE